MGIFCRYIPRTISLGAAAKISTWMIRNLFSGFVVVLFGGFDRLFYARAMRQPVKDIVMIIGQPRSGTTFFHRKLAQDSENFLGIPHLFWRFPSITIYKLLGVLGLRDRVAKMSYWGKRNPRGQKASRMHAHLLGHVEEDGIFLEERLWLHFFMFRRIPIPALVKHFDGYSTMTKPQRAKVLRAHERVLKKWQYLQGPEAAPRFILKENDAIDFVHDVVDYYGVKELIFLGRHPKDFMNSFFPLSIESTYAKTGIYPQEIPGWEEASLQKRYYESRRQVELAEGFKGKVVSIRFEDFTRHTVAAFRYVYDQLGLPFHEEFQASLQATENAQKTRVRGYQHADVRFEVGEFEAYLRYFEQIPSTAPKAVKALQRELVS